MMKNFPPLPSLRAFLVACHSQSFTEAAQTLCVTHGAISRHIQVIEKWFGVSLFYKQGLRRVPTPYALTLAQELSDVFDKLNDIGFRYGNGGKNDILNISVPTTLCLKWLIPRMEDFYQQYPNANIQIASANSERFHLISHDDLIIRPHPQQQEYSSIAFLNDVHCLVASEKLLKRYNVTELRDVFNCPVIDTLTRPGHWQQWLTKAKLNTNEQFFRHYRFDHFHISLQAILDGLGIGIGPLSILSNDISDSRLKILFPEIQIAPICYYALTPLGVQKTKTHIDFEQWLTIQKS
ncbi:LysR substrate-binding domain-containing protein [Proteus hauseri]|uniref:LysR substrate-binding domain-containing protein n=1 Tax=Proteus hauseri TaxID=183417 RepID=UPI001009496A|nr:LysR substrate-binding domain-containing protein [Proteus hauseri]QAV24655.1 LysR family transcriptional regulator [Proteus hauseri]